MGAATLTKAGGVNKEHWVIWFVAKWWYEHEKGELTLTRLNKLLFILNREFKAKFGKPLLDLEFFMYFYGPYSVDLEDILNDSADRGLIDYVVEVKIPHAPRDLDEDYAYAIIKHQLDEVDAPGKYVRKIVRPKAGAVEIPQDLEKLLKEIGITESELKEMIGGWIEEATSAGNIEDYTIEKYKLHGREFGERLE